MPCCSIITNTVEFKVENAEILKKALTAAGSKIIAATENVITVRDQFSNPVVFDLKNGAVRSAYMGPQQLSEYSNSVKRAYSKEVISEVAKRNKWHMNQLNQKQFQLIRY